MDMNLRTRIELLRQGIVHRAVIPLLEERGFLPSEWRRPISFEDMELKDEGWVPNYSKYTTWETYIKDYPLHIFFNTFYGDVYERAYRHCFVEFIIPWRNAELKTRLIGTFTRLNLKDGGFVWKNKQMIDLSSPEIAVKEIEEHYDSLLLEIIDAGLISGKAHKRRRI